MSESSRTLFIISSRALLTLLRGTAPFLSISSSKVSFIYQDNYYKKREDQSKDENGNYNFDLPTSFLNDELVRDLNLLKNGDQVVRKEYNFNNPNIDQKKVEVLPRPIIILEGLFIFKDNNIIRLLDHKIFVNA